MESVPLREYFEALLNERDKRAENRFASQSEAIKKAEDALTKRLDALNELRGDVATKSQIVSTEQRVQDIVSRLDRIEGRSGGMSAIILGAIALGTLVTAVVAIYFRSH